MERGIGDEWRAAFVMICALLGPTACYVGAHDFGASPADTSGSNEPTTTAGPETSTTADDSTSESGEPPDDTTTPTPSTTADPDTGTTMSIVETGSSSTGESMACGPMAAGTVTETVVVDGLERTYIVVVPASLDGGLQPAPVVMGFHGTNGTAEHVAETYGITGEAPALYVYPQALFSEEAGAVVWDIEPDGIDFAFFDAMLADLAEKYCVAPELVFAAGQSNGAFFVNELGCRRPDVLRAIAPVAGGGPSWYPDCTETMAVMVVHGNADETVPIEQGINARDFWLGANGCDAASIPIDPPVCNAYVGCDEPVLWCPHAGDHEWPEFAGPTIRGFFLALEV